MFTAVIQGKLYIHIYNIGTYKGRYAEKQPDFLKKE